MKHKLESHQLQGYNEYDLEYKNIGAAKREEGIIGKLNNVLATLMGIALIFFCAIVLFIYIFFMVTALGNVGIILAVLTVTLLIYFIALRVVRKRLNFMRKLKKVCRKNDLRIKKERGFSRSLRNNTEGFDLIVSSRSTSYYIRFFAAYRRASHLTFCDDCTVKITTNIHKSRFKAVLGLNKPRVKAISYSYMDTPPSNVKNAVKVLLVNPVPHDILKKETDGSLTPIGTGEKLYGYTLYTATGFLNELERNSK